MGRLEGLKESRGSRSNRAGPSSLFLLSETNLLRRTTKFLIEWPYPFRPSISCQRLCLCQRPKSKAVILPKSQFLKSNIYFSICPYELSVASVQALKVRVTYLLAVQDSSIGDIVTQQAGTNCGASSQQVRPRIISS